MRFQRKNQIAQNDQEKLETKVPYGNNGTESEKVVATTNEIDAEENWRDKLKNSVNLILGTLYPKHFRCALCGKELAKQEKYDLCERCVVEWNSGHVCAHCGKPLDNEAEYCEWCMHHTSLLTQMRSGLIYEGATRKLVRGLKFGRKQFLMDTIAPIFEELLATVDWDIDVIVPVPLSRKKLAVRGFNQAQLLALVAGKHFVTATLEDLLNKVKDIPHQARLNARARYENVKECFECNSKVDMSGKNVLIIDDVMTTGATLEECARTLSGCRPAQIYALTLASGRQRVNLK